ncbi:MAG TPA: M48 family metallopeptidase [Nevskiales bacterium]|nr:M48 family metallopeptidase [Nevskiales bacterium]
MRTVLVLTVLALLSPAAGAFTLFSEKQMASMGAQSYAELKSKTPISKDPALNARVACVAGPLTDLAGGRRNWEITVFDVDEANAFALPGNKIGVYRGLLKVATTPDQLAAVIGHEIGHVKARHSNERVSAQVVSKLGLQAVELFISGRKSSPYIMAGLGLGTQYGVLLPFGRKQESEADEIGLKLMARAGFDPRAAVQLWRNMQKSTGKGPPAFLSTHPSHQQRIRDLEHRVPTVLPLYQAASKPRCG